MAAKSKGKETHPHGKGHRYAAALLCSGCIISLALLVAWRNGKQSEGVVKTTSHTSSRSLSANSFDHNEYYWAVCGRSGRCSSDEPNGLHPASATSLHEVRCCSDTPISGWHQPPGCPYATSYLGGPRGPGCYDDQTHSAAAAICAENGARLCTRQELLDDCTRFTGCGHDTALIWSSTKCREAGETCDTLEDCCGARTCMGDGRCEEYATPAPTPEGCDTCLVGRVGHWNFDDLSSGYTSSSDGNTII